MDETVSYYQAVLCLHNYLKRTDHTLLAMHTVKDPISLTRYPDMVIRKPKTHRTVACFVCNDMTDFTCLATIASACAKNYPHRVIDEIAIFLVTPTRAEPTIRLIRKEVLRG